MVQGNQSFYWNSIPIMPTRQAMRERSMNVTQRFRSWCSADQHACWV